MEQESRKNSDAIGPQDKRLKSQEVVTRAGCDGRREQEPQREGRSLKSVGFGLWLSRFCFVYVFLSQLFPLCFSFDHATSPSSSASFPLLLSPPKRRQTNEHKKKKKRKRRKLFSSFACCSPAGEDNGNQEGISRSKEVNSKHMG